MSGNGRLYLFHKSYGIYNNFIFRGAKVIQSEGEVNKNRIFFWQERLIAILQSLLSGGEIVLAFRKTE